MHASIFQLSTKPISKEDWADASNFENGIGDWCDYIGDERKGQDRLDEIRHTASYMYEFFDLADDGESLIYKGGIEEFKEEWALSIRRLAAELTGKNICHSHLLWRIERLMNKTHYIVHDRYYIQHDNEYADAFGGFVMYADGMKKGDRLYFGAVYDFHY